MYKAILDSLKTDPIVFVDENHIVRYMNDVAKRKFVKRPEDDLVGQSIFECHGPGSAEKIKAYFKDMQAGKIESVKVRKKAHVQGIMQAVKDETGRVIGYIERHELIIPDQAPLKENHYQRAALYYDEILESMGHKDLDFYLSEVGQNQSVLEVGCGTGRIGLELAKQGNEVVGIDVSKEMIAQFNEKIIANWEQLERPLKTHCSSLEDFETPKRFDYILFPFRVFQVYFSDPIRKKVLEKAKSLLKENGRIIVAVFDPDQAQLADFNTLKYTDVDTYSRCLDLQIKRDMVGKKHFANQQIISYCNHYTIKKEDQIIERFEEPMRLAYQYDHQMQALFKDLGMEVAAAYGNWEKKPIVQNDNEELIYILTI